MQPHLITLQFHRKTRLQEVALYLDHQLDESYTPSKVSYNNATIPFPPTTSTLINSNYS